MLQTINLGIQFGGRKLFNEVNLKFTKGNCYGVIGANGAGKSTFMRLLSGELESTEGEVVISKNERMSVLNQNQDAFNNNTVLETVILGNKKLTEVQREKDELYSKPDFSDEDGIKAAELETLFAEMNGWEAESDAQSLLNSMQIDNSLFDKKMGEIDAKVKVKVLLAQALFGNPDILILDEPTNNLDYQAIKWLENFLINFENTVIIVSHNRHFLNKVCTHICDVDYGQINIYLGNYDFWYETSQLIAKQQKDANKKAEQRATELKEFIARFAANASKSRQATSRKKELEKLTIEDFKPSNRKYPFIDFKFEKDIGNEILTIENLTKKGVFENVSFTVKKDDKIAFVSDNSQSVTALFNILSGADSNFSGEIRWGKTITVSSLPKYYDDLFEVNLPLTKWIGQFSKEHDETYLRSWLGRMLFSGEEALKSSKVLSGGEKVRCMLAKMMLQSGNFLIMDEPTNHLDLESITALNNAMKTFKGSIIFTSHDEELVSTVANRIIKINNTKVFDKEINYSDYLELTNK